MKDDWLDEVLQDIYDNGASVPALLRDSNKIKYKGFTEAKAAINTYTTNKIIEELERVRDSLSENTIEEVEIGKIYDRIKALNHRKDKDEN